MAFETDQFTPTPAPLVDMGSDFNEFILGHLNQVVDDINKRIDKSPNHAPKYLSEKYVTRHFNQAMCPFWHNLCLAESWGVDLKNDDTHLRRYKPPLADSIYFEVFAPFPASFLFDSPSVNFFGTIFGTDKIGHILEQGYGYYEIYMDSLADGKTDEEARKKAVAHGVLQEQTYFGTMIDGVYSNGDLAADYAGLELYINLTHEVKLGDTTVEPILAVQSGHWVVTDRARDHLMNPFITEHLNEALNPCDYAFNLGIIRKHVQHRCQDWITNHQITKESETARLEKLSTWFGYDYGHNLPPEKAITFVTECFSGNEAAPLTAPAPTSTGAPANPSEDPTIAPADNTSKAPVKKKNRATASQNK